MEQITIDIAMKSENYTLTHAFIALMTTPRFIHISLYINILFQAIERGKLH
jgi:hypothetical protein